MTLDPALSAPLAVQIHLATIVPAFLIGSWQIFFSVKGKTAHRALGYTYLALMTVTSVAALFIREVNPSGPFGWSWIHLFVPLTLFGVAGALITARRHDIRGHRASMLGVYFGGILIAGALAFIPARIMHQIVFG
jgi:uncharacterized membrane protein